jgi:hypothetical protein
VAVRADAAFAKREIYEALEDRNAAYAIGIPANESLEWEIAELLARPPGRPSHKPLVRYKSFSHRAGSWRKPRGIVAKVEHHPDELFPRVGFLVTNLSLPSRSVVRFYNKRGTAEQWIKEGKQAAHWTRLSCHRFRANEVRLQSFATPRRAPRRLAAVYAEIGRELFIGANRTTYYLIAYQALPAGIAIERRLARLRPGLYRFRGRRRPTQESFSAQIFIEIGPVDAITGAADLPIPALLRGSIEKPRVPSQGNDDCPPIEEVDGHGVISEMNVLHALARLNFRTLHSISPIGWLRFR